MVTSMRMFGIEMANRNFWLSTPHEALTLRSQYPRVGIHCNRTSKNCSSQDKVFSPTVLIAKPWTKHTTAMPHINTIAARAASGILMLPLLNMRQYNASIESLTETITPV